MINYMLDILFLCAIAQPIQLKTYCDAVKLLTEVVLIAYTGHLLKNANNEK
jgi:hypothetical protein